MHFHGRVFEDFQNTDLNANSWFNNARLLPRNIVKLNDFGGSVGGPILKNKLFFFGTYAQSIQPQSIYRHRFGAEPDRAMRRLPVQGQPMAASRASMCSISAVPRAAPASVNPAIAAQLSQINGVLNQGVLTPTSDPNISTLSWQYAAKRTIYYPAMRFDYNVTEAIRFNVSYSQTKTIYPGANAAVFPGGIDTVDLTSSNSNNKIAGFGMDWTHPADADQPVPRRLHVSVQHFRPREPGHRSDQNLPAELGLRDQRLCQQYLSTPADLVVLPDVELRRTA